MTGKSISHYNVVDELGRGGMGVVYKAEDTKLDRTVAIKVLPPHALISEDDRNRFYREARAAAAINHPNIAHVYEIDEVNDAEGTKRPFIAMEFIDGETLADRIEKGPLPLKDALSIATQIAEGLKAAHGKDIVHRDVKSGNMMLTSDGTVKILDFGLAKTSASTRLTQMGSTLGTVAYMSPEQAKGEEVDRRSDIWSLGVILYEMIAGRLPFVGDYEQAVVYGILNEDPESLTTLRAGVPFSLDGIIAKMLAKDPDLRYQHVDELPADLKAIDISSAATTRISTRSGSRVTAMAAAAGSLGAGDSGAATVSRPAKRNSSWMLVAVAALVAGGLTAAGFLLTKPDAPPTKVQRYYMQLDPAPDVRTPVLSADGSVLAFRSGSPATIYVKSGDDFDARAVAGTEGSGWFDLSPDGRWLLFQVGGMWKRIPVAGDTRAVDIGQIDGTNFGGTWVSEDAVIVSSGDGLVHFDLSTGNRVLFTEADSTAIHAFPQYLPDRNSVLFTTLMLGRLSESTINMVSLESSATATVLEGATAAKYLPTGQLVFSRDTAFPLSMFAVGYDIDNLQVVGTPVPILEGNSLYGSAQWSQSGDLVLAGAAVSSLRRLTWVDQNGRESLFIEREDFFDRARISPRGDRVAVSISNSDDTDVDLWIYDAEGKAGSQLTFEHANENHVWMPDGEYLTFESDRAGEITSIWYQRADGSEPAVRLIDSDKHLHPWSFAPDGTLLADELDVGRISLLSPSDGSEQVYLDTDGAEEDAPMFSPDGKWIAYVSNELGAAEVFVASHPYSGAKWRVSTDGGVMPVWSPDGKTIYYYSGNRVMAAAVETTPAFRRVGVPKIVFERSNVLDLDLHPDGDRFLLLVRATTGTDTGARVRVVENWFEELKEIAPVGG
ncbi:MAG: serine/threonine-protein kinase [Rhodothermia bacterium]|nr:serine/threonine-protein kinase [Rhodothermia bacterium]